MTITALRRLVPTAFISLTDLVTKGMKKYAKYLPHYYYYIYLSFYRFNFVNLINFIGNPIFLDQRNWNRDPVIRWSPPMDNWNWTTEPRNQELFFSPSNFSHKLPPTANETELIAHMAALKRNYSRLLWDNDKSSNLPLFVDKALKLLNLKQVYYEVEHSVMSKVSCTACKAGAGLLQHYIRLGKSKDEINKMIYQFCVSLQIQSARVCEGITRLFGVRLFWDNMLLKHS